MNGSYVIEATGLRKAFGKTQALAELDLQVGHGEILGMLGPNGAGNTTTVRVHAASAGQRDGHRGRT